MNGNTREEYSRGIMHAGETRVKRRSRVSVRCLCMCEPGNVARLKLFTPADA